MPDVIDRAELDEMYEGYSIQTNVPIDRDQLDEMYGGVNPPPADFSGADQFGRPPKPFDQNQSNLSQLTRQLEEPNRVVPPWNVETRKDGSQYGWRMTDDDGKVAKKPQMTFPEFVLGVGEEATEMATGFAGSVPAFFTGMGEAAYRASKSDPYDPKMVDKALDGFLEQFLETQQFFTYHPKSESGKRVKKGLEEAMEAYSKFGKKHISGPAGEEGFPGVDAWAQTGWEFLPVGLLMRKQGIKIGKGQGGAGIPMRPPRTPQEVLSRSVENTEFDIAEGIEPRKPAEPVPEPVPDITLEATLPQELPPPKPVGERKISDIKEPAPRELGEGYEEVPRFDPEVEAKRQAIEQKGYEEGLRPEEITEVEKKEFSQEIDRAELDKIYEEDVPRVTIEEVRDPLRTPEEPKAEPVEPIPEEPQSFSVRVHGNKMPYDAFVKGEHGDKFYNVKVTPKGDIELYSQKEWDQPHSENPVYRKKADGTEEILQQDPYPWGAKEAIAIAEEKFRTQGGIEKFKQDEPPPPKEVDDFDYSVNPLKDKKTGKAKGPWEAKGLDVQADSMFDAIAKMGGIKREDAIEYLGHDPGAKLPTTVFGRPIFRKEGKAVDIMMEDLANEGYLKRDPVTGKADPREFEEKFFDESAGRKQWSDRKVWEPSGEMLSEYEQYIKDQMDDTKGGETLRTGLPTDEIKTFTQKAWQKVKDKLGIREKGIEIEPKPAPEGGAILSGVRSPSAIYNKIQGLDVPYRAAVKAERHAFELNHMWDARRRAIRDQLGGGFIAKTRKILGADKRGGIFKYSQNKKVLHGIMFEGDLAGKTFTVKELQAKGYPDHIIKAYRMTVKLYNEAWKMGKKHLEDFKQPIPEYMKGYVPHYFHEWLVRKQSTGEILDSGANLQKAVEIANKMKRDGMKEELIIDPKPKDFEGQEIQSAVIGDNRFHQMQRKLRDRFQLTPEEATNLLGGVFKKGGKSKVFENFLDRKGVTGWVKDLDYVENRYFNMISRYLAQDKFKKESLNHFEQTFGEFDKDWTGDARYVKNYINDVLGKPTRVEEMMNHFMKTAPGFKKLTENYLGDRPSHQVAGKITNTMSALKLAFYNLSSAGVNLTQLTNVYSKLGERAFIDGLVRAGKAHKDIAAKNWKLDMIKSPNSDLWVLKKLGVDKQQGYASLEGFNPGAFTKKSLYLFTKAEFINRTVAALGGYHKFMRENKHLPWKERRQQALNYAEDVNNKTNFNYGAEDAQSYLRQSGPPGKVIFQFKKFVGKQLEFMTTLKGAENARFWTPYILIGGYHAVPGIDAIIEMGEFFTGTNMELETKDAGYKWADAGADEQERALRRVIVNQALEGAGFHIGAPVGQRTGLGDAFTDQWGLGPAGSTAYNTIRDVINKESASTIVKDIATSPGNFMKAMEAKEGKLIGKKAQRSRMKARVGPWDRVLKGVGFRTTEELEESDKARIIGYRERKVKKVEEEAISGFLDAEDSGDLKARDKWQKEIWKYGITQERLDNERIKRNFLTQSERKLYNVPEKRRKDYMHLFNK